MFFQVSDQAPQSRKHRELAEQALEGHLDGIAAIGLWTMAGADSQGSGEHRGNDGVVRRTDLIRILLNPTIAEHLASILVEVGLWHAPGHDCPRCPAVAPDTYLFHDWFDMGYDPAAKVEITQRKRRELKDRAILNSVWARDCVDPAKPTSAHCRYCGDLVRRNDRRSEVGRRPQYDHVDPNKADGARNIVIACADCNGKKGNRTPDQADMVLLPPPRRDTVSLHPTDAEPVSPHSDAEHRSPDRAAETRSPDDRDAETTVSPHTDAEHPVSPTQSPQRPARRNSAAENTTATSSNTTKRRSNADQNADPENRGVPARVMRAGAGLAGSGQGMGSVVGLPEPEPHVRSPRKRRRRGKGRSTTPNREITTPPTSTPEPQPLEPVWDAGPAPEVPTPGRFGSPWHGWTGPPSPVTDETTCPTHHLPEPCWKCAPPEGHPHDH